MKNMKMNNRGPWLVAVLGLLLGLLGAPAQADEMDDLKVRFKERAPQLLTLRNAGTAGETFDGWVELVKPSSDAAVTKLIAEENADRRSLYAIIAAKQKITAAVVAERNALRVFKSAADDHYLKTKDGKWVQRKDVKIEG